MVDVLIRSSGRTSERVSVGFQPRCLRVRSLSITVENNAFHVLYSLQPRVLLRDGVGCGGGVVILFRCSQAL